MTRLQDKVCIITGAGSGMGRVAASMFCAQGARVVAADISARDGEETVSAIRESGQGEILFVRADVSREEDCANLVRETVGRFGRLDALYNNAGIMPKGDHSVVDTAVDTWDQVQDVNTKGIYLCCKYGIPAMIESGGGSVINVASFVALVGCSVPQDSYTASKGAVIALTKSLAVQFGPKGVRANAICPGPIETPLLTEWLLSDPAAKALRLNRIPMGRFGRAEDIVHLAIYLASDESSWTNGAALVVDGGITSNYF
jgi:NAD(P)-dependent dehydrogenase (short-subunit alcohol dehydrogenase family)